MEEDADEAPRAASTGDHVENAETPLLQGGSDGSATEARYSDMLRESGEPDQPSIPAVGSDLHMDKAAPQEQSGDRDGSASAETVQVGFQLPVKEELET